MYLGAAALALPAGAALALAVARGRAVVEGDGAVAFAVLAASGLAGVVAVVAAAVRERRARPPAVPAAIDALLRGVVGALGDAVLAFDGDGRLVWANDAAVALCDQPREALSGRSRDVVGEDVAVLLRGLERGPAEGRVTVGAGPAARAARAAAARVGTLDVVALRLDDRAAPSPPRSAEEGGERAPVFAEAELVEEPQPLPRFAAPALAAEVGAPVSSATQAASLLRLALPPGSEAAAGHLAHLEEALRRAEERLALLAAAPRAAGARERVDLDALLSDALAGVAFARGVRVRRACSPAPALGDPGALRMALRHVLRAAAAAMPAGGELHLRASVRDGEASLEIADSGAASAATLELAAAEHLVMAQGGRIERVAVPGRGALCRVVLPADATPRRAAGG
jgi:hypothetical protein